MYILIIKVLLLTMWRYVYGLMSWEYHGRKEQIQLDKIRWLKYNLTQEIKTYTYKLKPITQANCKLLTVSSPLNQLTVSSPLNQLTVSSPLNQLTVSSPLNQQRQWEKNRMLKYNLTQEIKTYTYKLKPTTQANCKLLTVSPLNQLTVSSPFNQLTMSSTLNQWEKNRTLKYNLTQEIKTRTYKLKPVAQSNCKIVAISHINQNKIDLNTLDPPYITLSGFLGKTSQTLPLWTRHKNRIYAFKTKKIGNV
jgi:hypothetical protein